MRFAVWGEPSILSGFLPIRTPQGYEFKQIKTQEKMHLISLAGREER